MEVKNGDLEKLSLLFEKYKTQLFNFFIKQTFDRDVSNDLLQNVFYKILKYRHSFNKDKKFYSWMYKIARNILNDYYFKSIRSNNNIEIDKLKDNNELDINNEKQENIEQLYSALNKLSPKNREIIVMCKINNMKYKDIAEIMDTSESVIKVTVHRAMNKLRKIYFSLN